MLVWQILYICWQSVCMFDFVQYAVQITKLLGCLFYSLLCLYVVFFERILSNYMFLSIAAAQRFVANLRPGGVTTSIP